MSKTNTEKVSNTTLTMGLAGDVMIGRLVNDHLAHVPSKYIWGDMLPLLKNQDVNLINLEAALTNSETIVPKVFNFKADPCYVQTLVDASVDVVNLANNHVRDYGDEGLLETVKTLDQVGIKHVGAGRNAKEAKKPVIISKKGITIGILGFSDNEPSWIAKEATPGIHYVDMTDINDFKKDIESIRKLVDIVLVSLHWGPNMRERPPQYFRQLAHALIDNGVDIIHGHSAHIFQGVECYKQGLILYDTGDFLDDYYVDPILRNDHSFYFIVTLTKQGFCSLQLIPTVISNFQVNKATGSEREAIISRMKMLSHELGTTFIDTPEGLFTKL